MKELAIRLANMHNKAKYYAQDKIQLFAGQKNFSGRTLKYIYNSINIRNYDLSEAFISVLEDCFSFSYKKPDEMKEILIKYYMEKPKDYNEIMSYLGRDEIDISEKYNPLITIIDEYVEKQIEFKYNIFLDNLDILISKDLEEIQKKIEHSLKKLKEKNVSDECYIFLMIINKILKSIVSKKGEENECAEYKIKDIEISRRIDNISSAQKKYLLFRKLIEKNYFNFNIIYKEYDNYIHEIEKEKINNPFFELFTNKKRNLIIESITLGLLYPEIEDVKYLKLQEIKK